MFYHLPVANTENTMAKRDIFRMHLHVGGQCLEGLLRPWFGICRSYFNKAGPRESRRGRRGRNSGTCSA